MIDIELAPWLPPQQPFLAALVERGAHAALLHGPAGAGKWNLALAFARDLLCERPAAGLRACASCDSCRLFTAGNHPDLRAVVPDALAHRRPSFAEDDDDAPPETEGASGKAAPSRVLRIEQIHQLARLTSISAHRGGRRVVVLGPTESLTAPAANALLKTLEEPPPRTLFLLVADQIDRCLPTILSRCTLLRIPVPEFSESLAWLQGRGVGGADLERRLREAGGAPYRLVRDAEAGLIDAEHRSVLLDLLRRGAGLTAAQVAAKVPRTIAIGPAVALFQRWGYDFLSYCLGAGLRYHPADEASFSTLLHHWSAPGASGWIERLVRLQRVAEHPLNARAAVEGALLDYVESIALAGANRK